MSSRGTIVNGCESGGIHGSDYSEPTTSTRARGSRKRSRVISTSPTPIVRPGPSMPLGPLLRNLEKHPSAHARAGRSIPTKNLNFRGAWPTALQLYHDAHHEYKELLHAAGFENFLKIDPVHIPQAYAIALTERWFSETNTVHLPRCEIGPTPLDWTMITGLRFRGRTIRVKPDYNLDRALELLGATRNAITDGKIRLSSIILTKEEVQDAPENDEIKGRIFRRLFLFIVGSCFFNNNRSVINYELIQFLERIDNVGSYNWGAVTYAAFLDGMRRKVTDKNGSFTGFWPFLVFWAFEYLDISRPELTEWDDLPRAIRWNCPRSQPGPLHLEEVIAFRCQLNFVEEDQVDWQPYSRSPVLASGAMASAIDLSKKRVPFQSLQTWVYYLGERCRRQLGLLCQVPHPPPPNMHGTRAIMPVDPINIGRSAESLVMDERISYSDWFTKNSIGKIVDVNQLLGGPNITGKVIEDWMTKHRPDMQLVLKSEYNAAIAGRDDAIAARDAAIAAHDAAVAECSKYRERRDGV